VLQNGVEYFRTTRVPKRGADFFGNVKLPARLDCREAQDRLANSVSSERNSGSV
jgi:hypothetical protein